MTGRRNQRGRGPSSPRGMPGRGRGSQRGRGNRGEGTSTGRGGYHTLNEMSDVFLISEIQGYTSGTSSPRGRGAGQALNPNSRSNTPRGRGRGGFPDFQSPGDRGRGRGRGRGIGNSPPARGKSRRGGRSKLSRDAPLSALLYEDRPLLRPVIFVPSVNARVLFQEEEEILQPTIEEVDENEESHVPTADRVLRVFSGGMPPNHPHAAFTSEDDQDDDELMEVDFHDMGRLLEISPYIQKREDNDIEERFTGIPLGQRAALEAQGADRFANNEAILVAGTSQLAIGSPKTPTKTSKSNTMSNRQPVTTTPPKEQSTATRNEQLPGFYVDTHPSPLDTRGTNNRRPMDALALPEEDLIIYVAPYPRIGTATPTKSSFTPVPTPDAPISLPSTSILTGITNLLPPPAHSSTKPTSLRPLVPDATVPPTSATTTPGIPPPPKFESVSFSFTPSSSPIKPTRSYPASSQHRAMLKQRLYETAYAAGQRRSGSHSGNGNAGGFGLFGAMVSEAQLRGGERRDPRWEERRRGDSDLDWGDEGEGAEGEGEGEGGDGSGSGSGSREGGGSGMAVAEGMDLDPDLVGEENVGAMKRFVDGLVGGDAGRFVSMDEFEDGQGGLEGEDGRKGGDSGGSESETSSATEDEDDDDDVDDEIDRILHAEESLLISEPGEPRMSFEIEDHEDDEDDEDDDEDEEDDASPRASFQARLARLRMQSGAGNKSKAKGKGRAKSENKADDQDDDPDEFDFKSHWDYDDEDEDLIRGIEAMLDENEDILAGRDRKSRNKLFRAIHNGAFEDLEEFKPARKSKDRYKDLPEELQAQWVKDREKKAANKRARAQARMEAASDPLAYHKVGKKGRKAMLAAARLNPDAPLPNRVMDMTTLVQQIRRFLSDVKGPLTMALPPMDKPARKGVHEMALAYGLKSMSKGKGTGRYITLIKRRGQGGYVDEIKVAKIMRRNARGMGNFGGVDRNARVQHNMPRHKEGEEVGKAAPKIGETNIGFRMLASMGWTEGQRIGGVNGSGLEAPLTAVIKNTKLGLGATK